MLTIAFGGAFGYFLSNYLGLEKEWFNKSKTANDLLVTLIGIIASMIPGMTAFGMGIYMTALGRLALHLATYYNVLQEGEE